MGTQWFRKWLSHKGEPGSTVNVPSHHAAFRRVEFCSTAFLIAKRGQWMGVPSQILAWHKSTVPKKPQALQVISCPYWAGLMQRCCSQGSFSTVSSVCFLKQRYAVDVSFWLGWSLREEEVCVPGLLLFLALLSAENTPGVWCKFKNISRFHLLPMVKGIWNPWSPWLFHFCKCWYCLSWKN